MHNALSPSLKALIADTLIKHSDDDVKVALASCYIEMTRITAPDAPYDDPQMKVCLIIFYFKLIEFYCNVLYKLCFLFYLMVSFSFRRFLD
jgi:hypothetical protein